MTRYDDDPITDKILWETRGERPIWNLAIPQKAHSVIPNSEERPDIAGYDPSFYNNNRDYIISLMEKDKKHGNYIQSYPTMRFWPNGLGSRLLSGEENNQLSGFSHAGSIPAKRTMGVVRKNRTTESLG